MEEKENYDFVNPSHYKLWEGTEAFDIVTKSLTKEELLGYLKGNILKYQLRLGNKPGESITRERDKIHWYKNKLNELAGDGKK